MAALTFKVSDDVSDKSNALYDHLKTIKPSLTKGDFFAMMIDKYSQRPIFGAIGYGSEAKEEPEVESNDLSAYMAEVIAKVKQSLQLPEDATVDHVFEEIRATQQRAMTVPDKIIEQVPEVLGENEIRFPIPEPHLSLLRETASRLSEKFGQQVTMRDVLLDMFARYTIEQFNQWFYPFVINGDDFKRITGHTQKELKIWLSKVDQEG